MIEVKKESGIYKIVSPTGKIYIGQSVNIKKRYCQYKNLNCKEQPAIFNSLKKYGFDKHIFEVVLYCSIDLLNDKERHYQEFYDSVKNGLNCFLTKTDILPKVYSKETIEKIKSSHVKKALLKQECICQYDLDGKFIKQWNNYTEVKLKYPSISLKSFRLALKDCKYPYTCLDYIWRYNFNLSIDFIKRVQEKMTTKKFLEVFQYDLEGNFIKEWKNQEEVLKVLGLNIRGCFKGRTSHCGGFIWKSKLKTITKEDVNKVKKVLNKEITNYIPIYQYSLDGDFIKIWKSRRQIKEELNINVDRVLYHNVKSQKGFVWSKTKLTKNDVCTKLFNKSYLKCRNILQYNLEGEFIKEWESGKEIRKVTKLQLNRYLNKKQEIIKNNYLWKYKQ